MFIWAEFQPYQSVKNPSKAYENNLSGYANVLEGCRRSSKVKRIIFSSTSAVYENNKEIPFKENLIINPDLIYSCTKQAGEILSKSYANLYQMDIIVSRFFNVYGEHQDIHRSMPPFMSYLAKEIFYQGILLFTINLKLKETYSCIRCN